MGLSFHPVIGSIVICDFRGFEAPEMTKKRPVIIISKQLKHRNGLCTVLPTSTTAPRPEALYHYLLQLDPPLPPPYSEGSCWVKSDMIYTVSLKRLSFPKGGKDENGKRLYIQRVLSPEELIRIQACLLHGIGLSSLTEGLH